MSTPLKANLGYRNTTTALRFLVTAFGFKEVVVYYGETQDVIGHAELRWPDGGTITIHSVEAGRNSIANLAALAATEGGYPAFSIHIDTDQPDALFARAVAAGANVVRAVEDSPFGTRGFVVSDTEGLYWSFGTPLPKLIRGTDGTLQPDPKDSTDSKDSKDS